MKSSNVSLALQAQVVSFEKIKVERGEAYQNYKNNLDSTVELIISTASQKKFINVNLSSRTLDSYANKRVRLIATVKQESSENILITKDFESEERIGNIVSFKSYIFETNRREVWSCLTNDKKLVSEITEAKGSRVELFGTVVMVPTSGKKYNPVLFVDKVNRNITFTKVLNPPKVIILNAKRILRKYEACLFEVLTKKICKAVGVVGDRTKNSAAKAVELSILAAASSPRLEDKNGKIHILFHGPPASGKQKALSAAKLVNPIFEEVTGGRVTVAGFASSCSYDAKANKLVSQKGYLAKADGGTVAIEDYHAMDENTRNRIMAILSPQMENGVFEDSTSARTKHSAATSIYLDGNFKGDVDKTKNFASQEEISLPYNIITRFDVIMDIVPVKATDESIVDMIDSTMTDRGIDVDNSILFKTIIATLLDQIPVVDLSSVKEVLTERYMQFRLDNSETLKSSSELQSIFARSYKSVRKIIVAHARLHQRSVATVDDVDYAMEVFNIKLKALRTLIPKVQMDNTLSGTATKTRSRRKRIVHNFSGETVSLKSVSDFLKDKGFRVGERTLRRDLDEVGTNIGGRWRIHKP